MAKAISLLLLAVACLVVDNATASTSAPAQKCPSTMFGVAKKHALETRGGDQEEAGVLELTTLDDVEAVLIKAGSTNSLVVIDFSATWCGPCKAIAPLFEELAQDTEGVYFLKVDVDENPDTAAKYSVSAMPTFLFIKNGEVVDRLMGANPARLQELIEQHK